MKRKFRICFILFFIFYFAGNCFALQTIESINPAFKLEIPDNFQEIPENIKPDGWLFAFKERTGLRDEPQITIALEIKESKTKDQNKKIEQLSSYFKSENSKITIASFDIGNKKVKGIEVINTVERVKSLMLVLELPAEDDFVQIIVGGNIQREDEIRQIFNEVISSFKVNEKINYRGLWGLLFFATLLLFVFSRKK